MATLIIRLETDPVTRKKNVWVKYDSDSDALPQEHEEQHKKLVEALLAGGTVRPEELGTLTIEREGQGAAKAPEADAQPAAPELVPVRR
jgi:hypothetical protein